MKEQPTPNRGQSNLFELPRCEGGKDREAGLKLRLGREQREAVGAIQNSKLRGVNPRFLLAARQRASKPCALLSLRSVGSKLFFGFEFLCGASAISRSASKRKDERAKFKEQR